ncbi:magnesium protoporphyrin IX methyltransferase [Marichromatium gracile]|uniref:Magnesium protoporphyrin IX methyltransferase n=1 Tax=Marichromatium gracile TaxID=1048 RepID=A0ABR5VKJ8_MARGR|nr:magnesium protoporphyrin IX methyltransferase [Marichromatium gracile]KXX65870.1 magnesium protoporphyrin O-methyltransferase [Marichromatium gracile]
MAEGSYQQRRSQIKTYFDRTASEAWSKLTSDAKVSRIRETVRAGRDDMRNTLLSWLPGDLAGKRLLDAGCGTGMLSVEAARRGAEVCAIDVAPSLIEVARERLPADLGPGVVHFEAGDMLDPAHGRFDHVVAMDSLIHYSPEDVVDVLAGIAERTSGSILFTFAPRTPLLALMHAVGKWFPRSDRSPAIVPVSLDRLQALIAAEPRLSGWKPGRTHRVMVGFYTSQALELVPA